MHRNSKRIPLRARRQNRRRRRLTSEQLELRMMLFSPWTNPLRPFDVNNDGSATPLDALLVINQLNVVGSTNLPDRTNPMDNFYDVSGDRSLSALDVLLVVNQINSGQNATIRKAGESERLPIGFLSMPLGKTDGVAGQIVTASARKIINRTEFNELGVFVVDDAQGRFRGLNPSDPGYADLVFSSAPRRVLFSHLDEQRQSVEVDLPADSFLRVYVLQSSSSINDASKHIRVRDRGNRSLRIGWEEQIIDPSAELPDRSFDDALIDLQLSLPLNKNSRPIFTSLPDLQSFELSTISFTMQAYDANRHSDPIRYSLDKSPPGASIDPITGRFQWQPLEHQGPGVFEIVVRATDSHDQFDTVAYTITIGEVNQPPIIEPIPDIQLQSDELWRFRVRASDGDMPADTLSYSIASDAIPGLQIDSSTGEITFQIPTVDWPTIFPITVAVTDNQLPAKTSTIQFQLTVQPKSAAPRIVPVGNQVLDEQSSWNATLSAENVVGDAEWTLLDAPDGFQLDPRTGKIAWSPSELQGPATYTIAIALKDDRNQPTTATFTVTVREVNQAPDIRAIDDITIAAGQSISFVATALDKDFPSNGLHWSLEGDVPAGASIDPASGRFLWTSSEKDAESQSSYSFRVRVTDDGLPSLSSFEAVTIFLQSSFIELLESNRFLTQHDYPLTILPGTKQLQLDFNRLNFDTSDSNHMRDAFEVALLDSQFRPLVHTVASTRDAFLNLSEGQVAAYGSHTSLIYDPASGRGTIQVDVSQLPAGTPVHLVARLINNDSDTQSRVRLGPTVQQARGHFPTRHRRCSKIRY